MYIIDFNPFQYEGLSQTDEGDAPVSDGFAFPYGRSNGARKASDPVETMNNELLSELVERTKLIASLNNISPLPLEGMTLDKVLSTILNNMLHCFGYYRGIVYLWDKKKENLACHATAGMSPDSERIVRSRPLSARRHDCIEIRAARTSTYTFTEDPTNGTELTDVDRKISEQHGGRGSVLYVPLRSKGETFGIMGVERFPTPNRECPEQFQITEKDIKSLMLFTNHASIAIENARLHEQNQRKIDYLYKLQSVYQELNTLMDLRRLTERVLEGGLCISGAETGIFWDVHEDGCEVLVDAACGYPQWVRRGMGVSCKNDDFQYIIRQKEAVAFRQPAPFLREIPCLRPGATSILLPIEFDDRVAAILQLDLPDGSGMDDTATEVLKIYSSQAGKLLENVKLYNQLLVEKRFTDNVRNSLGIGLLITDKYGNIRSINPKTRDVFNINGADLVRKNMVSVFKGKRRFVSDIVQDVMSTKTDMEREVVYETGVGTLILKLSAFVVHDEARSLVGVTTFIQDITEKKKLADSLNRMEKMAAMGTMAAGVAHELRNPLSGIYAAVQTLSKELILTDDQREEINDVLSEVDRMEILIREILQISRPVNLRISRTDINGLLRSSIVGLRESFQEKKIKVVEHLDPLLPLVQADGDLLRHVFQNLLLNAVDADPEEGVVEVDTRCVSSYIHTGERLVEIQISDNGSGVAEENLSKIFDPFFTTKNHGTGLGLTICQKIIQEHDGEIYVTQLPGQGSSFTVRLKL